MAKIRAIIFVTCLVSFQANAATLVKTGTGHIDETSSSGIGFGANKFYMSGATLVDVSLIFDATLEYDFSQNFSSPLTPIDQTPSISYSYNEYLTIDDPFGDLLAPETLSLGLFGLLINCSTTLVFFPGTPHDSTTCAASGSETFSSVPIDVTGIIPDDFTGLDIFNFSAESSFLGYVASVNNPVLTPGFSTTPGTRKKLSRPGLRLCRYPICRRARVA